MQKPAKMPLYKEVDVLYKRYVKMHLKSSVQYRSNLFMLSIASFLTSLAELITVFLMFQNFKSVGNWGFYESALMFGMVTAVYAFTECFARGFDEFANIIRHGDLDRILVRPVNLMTQIFGAKLELSKMLRMFLGFGVIVVALVKLNIVWTVSKVIVLILTFVCGCLVIWGVMMVAAGISVFTVENLEFINIFTNGAKEIAYYPINIYNKWLARIFTFVVPVACFNYLPISYLMGYGDLPKIVYALSPLMGMVFVIPCFLFFKWSLRRYQSTGS